MLARCGACACGVVCLCVCVSLCVVVWGICFSSVSAYVCLVFVGSARFRVFVSDVGVLHLALGIGVPLYEMVWVVPWIALRGC